MTGNRNQLVQLTAIDLLNSWASYSSGFNISAKIKSSNLPPSSLLKSFIKSCKALTISTIHHEVLLGVIEVLTEEYLFKELSQTFPFVLLIFNKLLKYI